jgi:hypothetical protein
VWDGGGAGHMTLVVVVGWLPGRWMMSFLGRVRSMREIGVDLWAQQEEDLCSFPLCVCVCVCVCVSVGVCVCLEMIIMDSEEVGHGF